MRTTVEISDEQHRALSAVAQKRGIRGFSPLVQEALDAYLQSLGPDEVNRLLELEGILSDEDEREARSRVAEARSGWRT